MLHLHLISDSTGDAVRSLTRSSLSLFQGADVREHYWPLIRTPAQLRDVLKEIYHNPGPIFFTINDKKIRSVLETFCEDNTLVCLSVLDSIVDVLEDALRCRASHTAKNSSDFDHSYFDRIEAMEFALVHDDGQKSHDLYQADVILIGVSRTSKTPTCMYLANHGVKAANIPFVNGIGLSQDLSTLQNSQGFPMVIGLITAPDQLIHLRRNRLRSNAMGKSSSYIDPQQVAEEVTACTRYCRSKGWPVLTIDKRSVEEISDAILVHLKKRGWKPK